ncbi:peptide-N4-(N-acetyl-beta-glucosaminyl)asparagine amidase A [Ophiocordyceps camponoti-floridani]|uniref:Peptide-N4-(N-acetyl-beta-glucosaminyl)asparagine amidase A n=1 Tax=Ophiocordyceps camponoti-floridani TaxID=2030778 RepID=A0A8H4VF27_9HYPO|nr:peptide-N4-(N-acetyl-beta-glucosaminyl)asparagine amidase A [Ophiocordyceps camponoti-floridani]
MPHRLSHSPELSAAALPFPSKMPQEAAVSQALEMARESPEGAADATVCTILENALACAWAKVKEQPDSYVMTRDEFAVFNYFQHRFVGDGLAVAARKRYWDHAHA